MENELLENELVMNFLRDLRSQLKYETKLEDIEQDSITFETRLSLKTSNGALVARINLDRLLSELQRAPYGTRMYFPGLFARIFS